MAFTHSFGVTFGAGSSFLGTQVNITGDVEQNFDLPSTLGVVTNQAVDMEWVQAKLQSIFIETDVDATLKLNSSSVPSETLTLKAGYPFQWYKDSGVKYPFVGATGNITAGYITTTAATNVKIRTLLSL